MTYRIIKGSEASAGHYEAILSTHNGTYQQNQMIE